MFQLFRYWPALLGLLLGAWFVLADHQPACAARFLEVRVERDGKVLLKASFGVPDRAPPVAIWRHLEDVSLNAVEELAPDPNNAEQATLSGDIRIVISGEVAAATVDRLRLVRNPAAPKGWRIPKDEVTRTGEAAGLDMTPSHDPGDWRWWVFAGVIGLLAICGVIALLIKWWTRRPQD